MAPQAARPLLANQSRALQLATGWFVPTGATVQWPPDDLVWDETTATSDYSFPEPNHWVWLQCVRCRQGLPTARACPVKHGSNPFGEGPGGCYPPYDATPQEGQEDEAGHHSPQGDEASEASEDHLAQFAAIFPDYDQVFQEGQEDSNQEGQEDSNQEDQEDSNQPPSTSYEGRSWASFLVFFFLLGVGLIVSPCRTMAATLPSWCCRTMPATLPGRDQKNRVFGFFCI